MEDPTSETAQTVAEAEAHADEDAFQKEKIESEKAF